MADQNPFAQFIEATPVNPFAQFAAPPDQLTTAGPTLQGAQPAWNAVLNPSPPADILATATGGALEGITGVGPLIRGGIERAAAATAPLIYGQGSYDENMARINADRKRMKAEHPHLDQGSQMVGGLMAGYGLANAAPGVASVVYGAGGQSMPARMAASGLSGAALSAADTTARGAVGNGVKLDDVAQSALWGGGIGAAVPPGAALVGAGIGKGRELLQNLMDWNAGRGIAAQGVSPRSARYLTQMLAADDQVARDATLNRVGPLGILADSGPNARQALEVAVARPGPGQTVARDVLQTRDAGTNARLAGDINRALGPAEDPVLATQNILNHRSAVDEINYSRAKTGAPPVDISKTLATIGEKLKTAEGMEKKALLNLRDSLMVEREVPMLAADGSPIMRPGPSVRNAPQEPLRTGRAPQSLWEFIKANGGIVDEGGDLKSAGLKHLINNKTGMPLDRAREAAAEAGYLGSHIDDAMSNTYVHDLMDALERNPISALDEQLAAHRDAVKETLANKQGQPRASGWSDGPLIPAMEKRLEPKSAAENLHNIRQEIDNVINYNMPGLGVPAGAVQNQQGALKIARGSLDEALKGQVPGFRQADEVSAALADRADAVKVGTKIFADGPEAYSPERLDLMLSQMQPGERAALSKGARGYVDRIVGTKANDLLALEQTVKGEGDWNRQRMGMVFGQQPTDDVLRAIERERIFRDTNNQATTNSRTAGRTFANDQLEAAAGKRVTGEDTGIIRALLNFKFGDAGAVLLNRMNAGQIASNTDQIAQQSAHVLTRNGPERDALYRALQDYGASRIGNAQAGVRTQGATDKGVQMLLKALAPQEINRYAIENQKRR